MGIGEGRGGGKLAAEILCFGCSVDWRWSPCLERGVENLKVRFARTARGVDTGV